MNTKSENFTRALKEQPLLATSWKCRYGWHTWEKYSEPFVANNGYNTDLMIQKKNCIHCNKTIVRHVTTVASKNITF